jgi:Carboxypeptidase regulatory-like domain
VELFHGTAGFDEPGSSGDKPTTSVVGFIISDLSKPLEAIMLKLSASPWTRHFSSWTVLLPILTLVIWVAGAAAQNSQVSGIVDDSSKARIQGATIALTHTETGERREVLSNAEGYFVFPVLQAGHYELRVGKQGFETQIKSGLEVLTGQTTEANFELKTGSVAQIVEGTPTETSSCRPKMRQYPRSSRQDHHQPPAEERTGDFSGAIAALDPTGALGLKVIDPNTGEQAVGDDGTLNKLPSGELDPFGPALVGYYPLPNVADAAVNKNNYSYNDPAVTVTNDYVARFDHVLGSKDNLYGRFLAEPGPTRPMCFPFAAPMVLGPSLTFITTVRPEHGRTFSPHPC